MADYHFNFQGATIDNGSIAAQWHPIKNGPLAPSQVVAGSNRRVWWICPEGHVWRTAVYNRTGRNKRTGCPVCAGNYKATYQQRAYQEILMPPAGKEGR